MQNGVSCQFAGQQNNLISDWTPVDGQPDEIPYAPDLFRVTAEYADLRYGRGRLAHAADTRPLPEQVRQAVRGRSNSARSAVPPPFATQRRRVTSFHPRPRHEGH